MRKTTLLSLSVIILLFSACQTTKWVAPPYTNVSKIIKLKNGMSIEETNTTLGIEPYDVFHLTFEGSTLITYNYRLKDRKMKVPEVLSEREKIMYEDERGQTEGTVYYGKPGKIFALFQNGKLLGLVTSEGVDNSEVLLITNSNIQKISKDQMPIFYPKDSAGFQIIPIHKINTNEKKGSLGMMQEAKKGGAGKILGIVGGVVLLSLLIGQLAVM